MYDLSKYTVTGVPSAFSMCASYVPWPSASVSIRTTVAPEPTLASAAALTAESASPVSGVSSLRWLPRGFWAVAPGGADGVPAVVVVDDELEPEAAEATP